MTHELPQHQIKLHALDATLADIRIECTPSTSGLEIRGRIVGPRRPGVSTIEVAYLVRPTGSPAGGYQVLIPEPSLWTPETPFVYEGFLEFWQDGVLLGRKWVSIGLRSDSRLLI